MEKIEKRRGIANRERDLVTTHGSSDFPLILLHPGHLSGGGPGVILLRVPPSYSSSSRKGGCSHGVDVPITWSGMCLSSCFLLHSLLQWEFFVQMH